MNRHIKSPCSVLVSHAASYCRQSCVLDVENCGFLEGTGVTYRRCILDAHLSRLENYQKEILRIK